MGARTKLYSGLYTCPHCGTEYECVRLRPQELYCPECMHPIRPTEDVEIWVRRLPGSRVVRTTDPGGPK